MRDGLVLLTTAMLTGMALLYHRLLRIENRRLLQQEIEAAGGKTIIFGTPVVSDGISMGTEAESPAAQSSQSG